MTSFQLPRRNVRFAPCRLCDVDILSGIGIFTTKIFHPNVSPAGDICVSTLKKDWKPSYGITHILTVIKCLLIYPNPESALDEEAGKMLLDDYAGYCKRAKLMTNIHATRVNLCSFCSFVQFLIACSRVADQQNLKMVQAVNPSQRIHYRYHSSIRLAQTHSLHHQLRLTMPPFLDLPHQPQLHQDLCTAARPRNPARHAKRLNRLVSPLPLCQPCLGSFALLV